MSNIKWPSTVRRARPSLLQRKRGEVYALVVCGEGKVIDNNLTRTAALQASNLLPGTAVYSSAWISDNPGKF